MTTIFRWYAVFSAMTVLMCFTCFPMHPGWAACPENKTTAADSPGIRKLNEQLAEATGEEKISLLVQRGELWQAGGNYAEARNDFEQAHGWAEKLTLPLLSIVGENALGHICYLQGDLVSAEMRLRAALKRAGGLTPPQPALTASCGQRLGTVLVAMDRPEEAFSVYHSALVQARMGKDPGLHAVILHHMAGIASNRTKALAMLKKARDLAQKIPWPGERMDLLLVVGMAAQNQKSEPGILLSFEALQAALKIARNQGDIRRQSHALGALGNVYQINGQWDDAYRMTEAALEAAISISADDLLVDWEWQIAGLLKRQGVLDKAAAACRRAIYHLQAVGLNNPGNPGNAASFYNKVASIHEMLVDILLTLALQTPESEAAKRQKLFREARDVMESAKLAELRDYFRDPCLAAMRKGIETLAPDTAVLYPILLPDRTALLVETGGKFICATSPVPKDALASEVRVFTASLRKGFSFKDRAGTLFDHLIRPVMPVLEHNGIKTIVVAPGGALRLLPMAALMDGDRFLIERYALVTVPGLTLLDPVPLGGYAKKALLAGMSTPGPVIYDLPKRFWSMFGNTGAPQQMVQSGHRGVSIVQESSDVYRTDMAKESKPSQSAGEKTKVAENIRSALTLPGVKQEIDQLSQFMDGTVLFDDAFQINNFSSKLAENPYGIVHIASHGFFGGSPDENFIMTFDKCLNMERIKTLIQPKQLATQPVELIALSACQTAEGDDRSPLGMAGIVLKSGARSALGSLWSVSDDACQVLFPSFYHHLTNTDASLTKAEALRQSQLAMIKTVEFRHPFYWAPFILVGNWL